VDLAIPTVGSKSHIAIDRQKGIIRRHITTEASQYDGARLREGPAFPRVSERSRGSLHQNEVRPPDDNTHRKPTERNQKPATISPNAHPVFLPANAWGDTSFINPLWKHRSPYGQAIATRRTQRPTDNAQTKRAQLYPKIA
jgi:hypothetical protein